jgi:hypothetical protein
VSTLKSEDFVAPISQKSEDFVAPQIQTELEDIAAPLKQPLEALSAPNLPMEIKLPSEHSNLSQNTGKETPQIQYSILEDVQTIVLTPSELKEFYTEEIWNQRFDSINLTKHSSTQNTKNLTNTVIPSKTQSSLNDQFSGNLLMKQTGSFKKKKLKSSIKDDQTRNIPNSERNWKSRKKKHFLP